MWDEGRALPELEKQTVVKTPIWQSLGEPAAPPPHSTPQTVSRPSTGEGSSSASGLWARGDSRSEQSASPLALAPVLSPR